MTSKLTDNYSKEKDFNNWDLNFGRIHQSSSKHGLVGFVVSYSYTVAVMDSAQLKELLECPVCLKQLDQTCKVLPCQHTFCRQCLRDVVETTKELRCPECRILVEKDVDNLPANIFLVRFLEGLKWRQHRKQSLDSMDPEAIDNFSDQACIPSARALYDYEPKAVGDLALHKGDIITLLKQIDENWYEGRSNGCQGFLPANYIEVISPLPSLDDSFHRPIAKALFDFEDEQEQDLLAFKQNDIISVIRQVDENWCEGELNGKQGIFPVTFVELNIAARNLIEGDAHAEDRGAAQSPRKSLAPETNKGEPKRHTIHFGGQRNEESQASGLQRRSLDISSSGRLADTLDTSVSPGSSTSESRQANIEEPASPNSPCHAVQARQRSPHESNTGGSRPVSAEMARDLYVALYSYKPAKDDELELVRNENYCVTEKCKDGWFKGYCVSSQKRGVFPGNYVRLASLHNLLTRSRSNSVDPDTLLNPLPRNNAEPVPAQNQRPPPPRHCLSEGGSYPRVMRSESAAPDPPHSLVVKLNQGRNLTENRTELRPLERSRFVPTSPLPPPPPAPKSSGLWKKLTGKKKERAKPFPPAPPTLPYQRGVLVRPNGLPPPPYEVSTPVPPFPQVQHRVESPPTSKRCRVLVAYPPQHETELELRVGDIVHVTKTRPDGWYKGTLERNGKTGLFPGSFVEGF